jgi:DNA-binding MarR family transcriptional regulator
MRLKHSPAGRKDAEPSPARRVVTGLAKIGMALRSRAWKEPGGLTPTQGQILAVLRATPGLRLTELADALGVTPATASDAASALARKGLLRKSAQRGDGRAVALGLTRRGAAEAERTASWPDFLLSVVQTLSEEEQGVFLRGLTKMIRTLQERRQIPVSRMCATCRYFEPHRYDSPDRPHHCAFVDAPFGDAELRLDCADHKPPGPRELEQNWRTFVNGRGSR